MKFNVNDHVKVRLTPIGAKIIRDLRQWRVPNESGWVEFQLWDLMHTFGPYMGNGLDAPFETTIEL